MRMACGKTMGTLLTLHITQLLYMYISYRRMYVYQSLKSVFFQHLNLFMTYDNELNSVVKDLRPLKVYTLKVVI